MSYSFEYKCGECGKFSKCIDYPIVRGAIDTIHSEGLERNHMGSGVIKLECQNFVSKAGEKQE